MFNYFLTLFNKSKTKDVFKVNVKILSKAKKHKYIPLDEKDLKQSEKNIAVGEDIQRQETITNI